jgi:hypothetical protein
MSSKDNNIEVVVRAVDEFSKAMGDFKTHLKAISDQSTTTEKSVNSLGDRLMGFGNILQGFLRQAGVDAFEFLKNGFESLIELIPQAYEQGYQWVSMVQQMQVETGMAAGTVSTYAAVMHVMGIDTDSTAIILARFGKNLIDSESKFKDLGIATRDTSGQMLTAEQVIENTRKRVAELGPSFMATAAAQDLFGRSGYKMLEFLNLSDEQFKALAQDASNAGLVLSQETLDAAHRFGIEVNRMNDTITGVQTSIFAGLEPSLEHFVDSFATFIQNNLNTIVGFVVSVANFVMGVLAGLFGIDMSAPTLAAGATAGETAPTGSNTPTPAPKGSGGGSGASATNADTEARKASIKAINDQIAALQALGTAQSAANQQADLEKAISDAQRQLTDLQSSVLNTYGLSDAERIKAEQKRAADVATAETKVVDTQKKYADWGADQQRQAQIEQLNIIKAGLQEQNQAQASGGAAAAAGYITTSAAIKTTMDGLGKTIGDFSQQAKDGIKAGLDFSDWIKKVLTPTLAGIWQWITDWIFNPIAGFMKVIGDSIEGWKILIKGFGDLLNSIPGVSTMIMLLVDAFGALWDWLTNNVPGLSGLRQVKTATGDVGQKVFDSSSSSVPHGAGGVARLASGGIVDRPTIAMIGEGGQREAVVPEDQWASFGGGGGGSRGPTYLVLDRREIGRVVDEAMGRAMPLGVRSYP